MRLAVLSCLVLSAGTLAAAPRSDRTLPMTDCLDPSRARSWHMISTNELLVDAGRRRFHLTLSHSCPELTYSESVVFRAGNGVGRLCGHIGDAVVPSRTSGRRHSCPIGLLRPITKAEFDALAGDKVRGVVEVREGGDEAPGPRQ